MENIQVALRVRPLNRVETHRGEENIWVTPDTKTVALSNQSYRDPVLAKKLNAGIKTNYSFDYCFNSEQDNSFVYDKMVKRVALSSLNGFNGTIFMYGQTGSGKTYTMMGYNKGDDNDNENSNSCSDSPVGKLSPKKNMGFAEKAQTESEEQPSTGEVNQESFTKATNPSIRSYNVKDISQNTGILILALKDIFQAIENDLEKTYFLKCSYVEIYNDQIYDLLNTSDKLGETLAVNEDSKKEFFIKGVTEEFVSSIEEILQKLQKGEANRHYARTMMNHTSSRSHTIFRLNVQTLTNNFIREYRLEKSQHQSNINNPELKTQVDDSVVMPTEIQRSIVTESLLNFVDLAGSEKVSNHHMLLEEGPTGSLEYGGIYGKDSIRAASKVKERVKEGQHINKSLFFLTQVISLKSEGKPNQHIPYRNSPLTKILRSSLGGNSRTLVILCATPAASQFEQTVSTLRFGMNAKKIENRVQANIVTNDETEVFRILITDYERKLRDLEMAKHEDNLRYNNLLRQIDELRAREAALIERMNNILKFQLGRMAETIPKEDLAQFFKQVQGRLVHLDKVGILFTAKSLKKYDSPSKKKRRSEGKKSGRSQSSLNRLPYEDSSSDEEPDSLNSFGGVAGGMKEKAKSMMSQLSMVGLKSAKQQTALLQKKIVALQENFAGLAKRNIENYENYLDVMGECDTAKKKFLEENRATKQRLREKCNLAKKKIEDLVGQCKKGLCHIAELKSQLRLYKDMQGLDELSDEELARLESHLWAKMDDVKTEKARRVVQKETGIEYVKKSLYKSLSVKEEEELMVSLNDIDTCESSYNELEIEVVDVQKQAKIDKEAEEFTGIFKKGVSEIDQELEQLKKVSIEMEMSLLEKEKEMKEQKEVKQRNRRETSVGAMSNRSREKDHQRQLSLRNEPRLDLTETIAELKMEMELLKLKCISDAELHRSKSMNDMTLNRKIYQKIKQDKKDGKNNSGSLVFDSKGEETDPKDKTPKWFESKEDFETDTSRLLRIEQDLNNSQEDLLRGYKGSKDGKLVSVVSVKEILNGKGTKTGSSRPSIDKVTSNKRVMDTVKEKLKKSMTQTFQRSEGNGTSRGLSTERDNAKKKEQLTHSRRSSVTEKREDLSQTSRATKTEDDKDSRKKESSVNSAVNRKLEKDNKAKSVEKLPKRRKDEEDSLAQKKKLAAKARPSSKSKERAATSLVNSPEGKSSRAAQLRLLLDESENRSFMATIPLKDPREKHHVNIAQEFNSRKDIDIQEKLQENRYFTPQKMGVHRKNNISLHNIKEEESKVISFDGPFTDMASIDVNGELEEKNFMSYTARITETKPDNNGQYFMSHRGNEPNVCKSAILIESRSNSITRLEGDLNTSDIAYSVGGEDPRKRRSREERRKDRTSGTTPAENSPAKRE